MPGIKSKFCSYSFAWLLVLSLIRRCSICADYSCCFVTMWASIRFCFDLAEIPSKIVSVERIKFQFDESSLRINGTGSNKIFANMSFVMWAPVCALVKFQGVSIDIVSCFQSKLLFSFKRWNLHESDVWPVCAGDSRINAINTNELSG